MYRHDIESILQATPTERTLLRRIMSKESGWDDNDNVITDGWTEIVRKGYKQICFEELYRINYTASTTRVEASSVSVIQDTLFEFSRSKNLNALECCLMDEFRYRLNEMKEVFRRGNERFERKG